MDNLDLKFLFQSMHTRKILTGTLFSELSKTISTNADITLGPVPSWSNACLCSSRRCENSSESTNWMAAKINNHISERTKCMLEKKITY